MDNKIESELRRISKANNGILKPEDVVSAAESKSSPLHKCFTWDDSEAAKQYRLEEARRLIRATVTIIERGDSRVPVRVYCSLSTARNYKPTAPIYPGYREVAQVMREPELRKVLLEDALRDFEYFEEKYTSLKELSELFSVAKRIKEKHLIAA